MIKYCSLQIQLEYYVYFLSCNSLFCLGLIFICLFYLCTCSTFSSEKILFLNAQIIYQFLFFLCCLPPKNNNFHNPSAMSRTISIQASCTDVILRLPFTALLLHNSLFPGTLVSLFLTILLCWSMSPSSFLRKDAWEIGFLSPCISESILFLNLTLNLAENRILVSIFFPENFDSLAPPSSSFQFCCEEAQCILT